MKHSPFSADWLARRLAALVPGFPNVAVCVALSGGLDSVVLLTALATRLRGRLRKGTRLRAVHVHHGLHANADTWTDHCTALAARLDVPLQVLRIKVARPRGASVEAAARDARYDALAGVLTPGEVLLTAHHEDDQLETVLLQLMRGAGIAGLAAMPDVMPFAQGSLVRPLLTRSRAELEAWARSQTPPLSWVDDDTNENEQLDRNYLRRRVLPLLSARWPSASRSVARSARHAAEAKSLLDTLARADVERAANGPALSVQHLRALAPERRRNAVRFWIARAGYPLPDTTRLDEITRTLLDARDDANPNVEWNGTRIQRHADLISLERAPGATAGQIEDVTWNWRAHAQISLGGPRGTLSIDDDPHGPINLDTLPETLLIRARRGGERLRPRRGGPTKSLKSLLQESRTPLTERANLPLIFAHDALIAIADRWLDETVHAASGTRHRGRIRWHRT